MEGMEEGREGGGVEEREERLRMEKEWSGREHGKIDAES